MSILEKSCGGKVSVEKLIQWVVLDWLPWWLSGKEPACQCRKCRSNPQEDPLQKGMAVQYSCLENPMDRGAWWATVHGVAKESDAI